MSRVATTNLDFTDKPNGCDCAACTATQWAWKPAAFDEASAKAFDVMGGHFVQAATVAAAAADEDGMLVRPGRSFYGALTPAGDEDVLRLRVVAGETYLVALRGTGDNGVSDTFLGVFDKNGNAIAFDDDGGNGISSLITFTATETGTYSLYAASFEGASGEDYRIDVIQASTRTDVGDTFDTAAALKVGNITYGFIDDQAGTVYNGLGEVDTFKVTLQAGKYYTFDLAGGADYETDPLNVPAGELDTVMFLYDADGNRVAFNDDNNYPRDISSGLGFYATTGGTYYLDVTAYAGQTGGYSLVAKEVDLAGLDPLDSINWVNAANIPTTNNVATVYFATSGQNFGELADDGSSPLPSFGWNSFEKDQVFEALREYSKITGITYVETADASTATFRLITTESTQYGAYFYPQDPSYGSQMGIGAFNVLSGGWNLPGQESLQRGGYSFGVILHEFGHAHGLAHPHDNGGGSDIMVGVTGADSRGIFDLNQGVYTVMSYNDAWETHPDGPSPFTRDTIGQGYSGSLSAFDIAALQERYGVHDNAVGSDIYLLKDVNRPGTYYQTIWDTGGTDEIRYDGAKAAQIDLLAATLDYTPTGGGVVSFVDGIWGGYTIANGVVIENATGGSGDDVILGNDANNVLNGRGGADHVEGRGGDDIIYYDAADKYVAGGVGNDTLVTTGALTIDLSRQGNSQVLGKSVFGFENVDATNSTGAIVVAGSDDANQITGGRRGDTLSGAGGDDVINGGGGADTLIGGRGSDVLNGGAGNDRIYYDASDSSVSGGAGNDTLVLTAGDVTVDLRQRAGTQIAGESVFLFENVDATDATSAVAVIGSRKDNVIIGGSANDQLIGGGGADTLTGNGGADRFIFQDSVIGDARTTITDFSRGQGDRIDLSLIDAKEGGRDNAFTFIGSAAFSGAAGELRAVSSAGSQLISGDVDGDGVADFNILVQNTGPIVATDLVL